MAAPDFVTYKKYKFNHETGDDHKGRVPELLGLAEGFSDEVIKTLKIAEIEHTTYTQMWEDAFNKLLPQNAMEAFYIGWIAAKMYEQKNANPLEQMMKMFGGERD